MSAAVVIPFGGDCTYRRRALGWQLDYYRTWFPEVRLVVSHNEDGLFNFAEATNTAVESLPRDVDLLILTGADSFVWPAQLTGAIELAQRGPGYVRAFSEYRKVSRRFTELASDWLYLLGTPAHGIEWSSSSAPSPGVGVIQRDCFQFVGGYDPGFQGWGYEDIAFNLLLEAHWPPRSVDGTLVHHWHPRDERPEAAEAEERNRRRLEQLYMPHVGDPAALLRSRFIEAFA